MSDEWNNVKTETTLNVIDCLEFASSLWKKLLSNPDLPKVNIIGQINEWPQLKKMHKQHDNNRAEVDVR